jgi:hypothetical protein
MYARNTGVEPGQGQNKTAKTPPTFTLHPGASVFDPLKLMAEQRRQRLLIAVNDKRQLRRVPLIRAAGI